MKIIQCANNAQGFVLPKFDVSQLTANVKTVYSHCAVAKSTVGIGTPFDNPAHSRQLFAGFFMRTICTHFCNSLGKLHSNYGGLVEAAKAGRVRVYGSSNLDQSITSQRLEPLGDGLKPYPEAVTMTTTHTQAVTTAMIYTFLIAGGVRTLSTIKRIRTVSVVAQSELLARNQLNGLPLVFVSRTPNRSMGVTA